MLWKELLHHFSAENGSRKLGQTGIKLSMQMDSFEIMLAKHKDIFREGLGMLKGIEAKVLLRPQSQP